MLDEAERKQFRSLSTTLNYVKYAAEEMHEDVGSDTRELERD